MIMHGLVEFRIPIYLNKAGDTSYRTAFAKVFSQGQSGPKFQDNCRASFKQIGFRIKGIDEIMYVSADRLSIDLTSEEARLAKDSLRTGLPTLGELHVVDDSTRSSQSLASPVHERKLVNNFVTVNFQARCLEMFPQTDGPKSARRKLLQKLSHDYLIKSSKSISWHDVSKFSSAEIANALRSNDSQNICYVLSENSKWDASYWYLENILENCLGSGYGIIISCLPGHLLYVELEDRNSRYIVSV